MFYKENQIKLIMHKHINDDIKFVLNKLMKF